MPALRACAEHQAGQDGVREVVGRRFALYPQPERSDGEWQSWWADYHDALHDVPLVALNAAMSTWVKRPESQFLPKPGELRALALASVTREGMACDTIWTAQRIEFNRRQVEPEPEAPKISAEEREQVKAMVADFVKQAKARQPAVVTMRATHGKTDETGITSELRALIERQREA